MEVCNKLEISTSHFSSIWAKFPQLLKGTKIVFPTWRRSYQEGAPGWRGPCCQLWGGQGGPARTRRRRRGWGGPAGQTRWILPSFSFSSLLFQKTFSLPQHASLSPLITKKSPQPLLTTHPSYSRGCSLSKSSHASHANKSICSSPFQVHLLTTAHLSPTAGGRLVLVAASIHCTDCTTSRPGTPLGRAQKCILVNITFAQDNDNNNENDNDKDGDKTTTRDNYG